MIVFVLVIPDQRVHVLCRVALHCILPLYQFQCPPGASWSFETVQSIFKLQQAQEYVYTKLLLLWSTKLDQGTLLRYARLETLFVVNVARRGTLIHYAEAVGHPYTCKSLRKTTTRVQRLQILHTILHIKGRITTSEMQQPQDCTSLQTGCQQTE